MRVLTTYAEVKNSTCVTTLLPTTGHSRVPKPIWTEIANWPPPHPHFPISLYSIQLFLYKNDVYIMPRVYVRTGSCTPRAAVRVDTRAGRVTKRWRRTLRLNQSGKLVYLTWLQPSVRLCMTCHATALKKSAMHDCHCVRYLDTLLFLTPNLFWTYVQLSFCCRNPDPDQIRIQQQSGFRSGPGINKMSGSGSETLLLLNLLFQMTPSY